jgi:hypothetical protein
VSAGSVVLLGLFELLKGHTDQAAVIEAIRRSVGLMLQLLAAGESIYSGPARLIQHKELMGTWLPSIIQPQQQQQPYNSSSSSSSIRRQCFYFETADGLRMASLAISHLLLLALSTVSHHVPLVQAQWCSAPLACCCLCAAVWRCWA